VSTMDAGANGWSASALRFVVSGGRVIDGRGDPWFDDGAQKGALPGTVLHSCDGGRSLAR